MARKEAPEIFESRHEFVPPPEKRHKKRTKFKKGQQVAVGALLLAGLLMLAPVGKTLPPQPDGTVPPVQPTETTAATEATAATTEAHIDVEPPSAELYPVMIASEFTGVVILPEPDRVLGVYLSVWEKTQERMLTGGEVPEEIYRTGTIPLPEWSFWDDYEAHADEYSGSMLDEGSNYLQELRVELRYDNGNGETKTVEYAAEAVADDVFHWLWPADEYDALYGTAISQPDSVSALLMISTMDGETPDMHILVNEPDKVTDEAACSVRAEIDGEPVDGVTVSYVNGLPLISVPIPEGMERNAGHYYRIYVTRYVSGYGKAIEFATEDDF